MSASVGPRPEPVRRWVRALWSRPPLVTIALTVACLVASLLIWGGERDARRRTRATLDDAVSFVGADPTLDRASLLSFCRHSGLSCGGLGAYPGMGLSATADADPMAAGRQQHLDDLVDRAGRDWNRRPSMRWALVREDLRPASLVTHPLIHAGPLHLAALIGLLWISLAPLELMHSRGVVLLGIALITGAATLGVLLTPYPGPGNPTAGLSPIVVAATAWTVVAGLQRRATGRDGPALPVWLAPVAVLGGIGLLLALGRGGTIHGVAEGVALLVGLGFGLGSRPRDVRIAAPAPPAARPARTPEEAPARSWSGVSLGPDTPDDAPPSAADSLVILHTHLDEEAAIEGPMPDWIGERIKLPPSQKTGEDDAPPRPDIPLDGRLRFPVPFGRFILTGLAGQGGMATVFHAALPGPMGFEKRLVVKVIRIDLTADEYLRRMLVTEALIGAQLHHPNVVEVIEFGEIEGRYYLAMELIDGISLKNLLRYHRERHQPISAAVILLILEQILEGLAYAHAARSHKEDQPLGVVHRDLKPANVLADTHGVVKILDFGIARAAIRHPDGPQAEVNAGTPRYMSPEQVRGRDDIGPRSDLFALGGLLYELVVLRPLFWREDHHDPRKLVLTMPLDDAIAEIEAAIPGLGALTTAMLERDPDQRAASADELLRVLRDVTARLGDRRNATDELRAAIEDHRRALQQAWIEADLDGGGGSTVDTIVLTSFEGLELAQSLARCTAREPERGGTNHH